MANGRIKNNYFYRDYYKTLILALVIAIIVMILLVILLLYQVRHRPLPQFTAHAANGQQMPLTAFNEPNLLTTTLTQWASKAAVTAYTYDFVDPEKQLLQARPYFTDAGWEVFRGSISNLLDQIKQRQLVVSSVVTGPPVISNQGDLPGRGYVWRIQLPFLVTYQSSDTSTSKAFTVTVTIVRVPTWKNPAGIGIDQFVM